MARRVVDLRSDTVTHPTDEMREAMRSVPVGDDVYGEDPSTNELEAIAAKTVGMESGIFVPSGTMANEIAIYVHTKREGEIIVEAESHIELFETGGPAILSGVQIRTVKGERGVFTPRQFVEAIRGNDPHEPATSMVSIENTHNLAGGTCWTPAQVQAIGKAARERGIPLHVDGARLFNSAVAQGLPASSLTKGADSAMFSLSKGLSAPVGSVLCGPKAFIDKARRVRKLLGGGMRQTGVLAAPGLIALRTMVARLKDDHANARRLAAGLSRLPGLKIDLEAVQTNIIMLDVAATKKTGPEFAAALEAVGVRTVSLDPRRIRLVTHRHILKDDVDWALERVGEIVGKKATVRGRA